MDDSCMLSALQRASRKAAFSELQANSIEARNSPSYLSYNTCTSVRYLISILPDHLKNLLCLLRISSSRRPEGPAPIEGKERSTKARCH